MPVTRYVKSGGTWKVPVANFVKYGGQWLAVSGGAATIGNQGNDAQLSGTNIVASAYPYRVGAVFLPAGQLGGYVITDIGGNVGYGVVGINALSVWHTADVVVPGDFQLRGPGGAVNCTVQGAVVPGMPTTREAAGNLGQGVWVDMMTADPKARVVMMAGQYGAGTGAAWTAIATLVGGNIIGYIQHVPYTIRPVWFVVPANEGIKAWQGDIASLSLVLQWRYL